MNIVEIYTDGACSGNGRKNPVGGWGYVVFINGVEKFRDSENNIQNTTNNRMELQAILKALEFIEGNRRLLEGVDMFEIISDSSYCIDTITNWMYSWHSRGWMKSNGARPENLDLIQQIYIKMQFEKKVTFVKVKGHSGVLGNMIADQLATGKK